MKIAQSLDDYIFSNIFLHPSLYYRGNFEHSRFRVLNHTFLVNGNGVEYVPELKNFNNHGAPVLSKNKKNRLKNGEKLVEVCAGGKILNLGKKTVWRNLDKKYKIYLEKDFNKLGIKYLLDQQELPDNFDESTIGNVNVVSVYPDRNIEYEEKLDKLGDNAFRKPYPFSLHYVPMWDRQNNKLISKDLIAADWCEGIVWTCQKALDWINSKEFDKDRYYNWAPTVGKNGCYFTEKWNKKKSVEQICTDYAMPFKNYESAREMAVDIVARNKKEKIDTARLMIDTYK